MEVQINRRPNPTNEQLLIEISDQISAENNKFITLKQKLQ